MVLRKLAITTMAVGTLLLTSVIGFVFCYVQNPPQKNVEYYHHRLKSKSFAIRQSTKEELVRDPKKSVPILIEILGKEKVRQAEVCLIEIGGVAIPELRKTANKSHNESLRCSILRVFSYYALEGTATPAHHVLIVKDLAIALADKSLTVRRQASLGFSVMGKAGAIAETDIRRALKDADLGVRLNSVDALCRITSKREEVIPILKGALLAEDTAWHHAALGIIHGHQIASEDLVDSILVVLKKSDRDVQLSAVQTLEVLGKNAKRAASALRDLNRDVSAPEPLREAAAKALKSINP